MPKRSKKCAQKPEPEGLWVAQQYSLKGPDGERPWEHRRMSATTLNRFLELADIALGLKKPSPEKDGSSPMIKIKAGPHSS